MSAKKRGEAGVKSSQPLIVTWVFMLLGLVVILLLPDWFGYGGNRPVWLFGLPIAFGVMGSIFALVARRPWWAIFSAMWGLFLIQALVVVITLVGGP
jgi:hypothetical protein